MALAAPAAAAAPARLAAAPALTSLGLHAAASMVLILVCMQMTPIVWACTDGMRVLGAELAIHGSFRYTIARRWAELM